MVLKSISSSLIYRLWIYVGAICQIWAQTYDLSLSSYALHTQSFGGDVPLFLVYFLVLTVLQAVLDRTGITSVIWLRVDDNYMEFLMVAPQHGGGDSVNVAWCAGGCGLRSNQRGGGTREMENISRGSTFGNFVNILLPSFKCNVLLGSLSVDSQNIPCAH